MKTLKSQKGFTLLEIMIVVVIIAISAGLSLISLQSSQLRADVNAQVTDFIGQTRVVQSNAKSGLNNTSHGIHLDFDGYTVFQGSSYSVASPQNFTINLPSTIRIENINLNGGGSDIIFDSPYGETSEYGTLQFVSSQINKTVTITVTELGTVNF